MTHTICLVYLSRNFTLYKPYAIKFILDSIILVEVGKFSS